MLPLFMNECDACLAYEERTFRDTWTGIELCLSCLGEVVNDTTNSPCSEKDNLVKLLNERLDAELDEHQYC